MCCPRRGCPPVCLCHVANTYSVLCSCFVQSTASYRRILGTARPPPLPPLPPLPFWLCDSARPGCEQRTQPTPIGGSGCHQQRRRRASVRPPGLSARTPVGLMRPSLPRARRRPPTGCGRQVGTRRASASLSGRRPATRTECWLARPGLALPACSSRRAPAPPPLVPVPGRLGSLGDN